CNPSPSSEAHPGTLLNRAGGMIRRPTTVGTSRPAPVGVLPIGDPKDDHSQPVIPNCVDDPIVAYANPVEVVYPAKLLDTGVIAPVPRNSANSDEFSRKEWLEFLPVTLAY